MMYAVVVFVVCMFLLSVAYDFEEDLFSDRPYDELENTPPNDRTEDPMCSDCGGAMEAGSEAGDVCTECCEWCK